jgi:predicted nucleic acid-binding protein
VTVVVDSSVVVAALVADGAVGEWASSLLASQDLAAPHLLPVEVANVLRRAARSGDITGDVAVLAHADLLELNVELFAYGPFGPRVWELRDSLTAYDAWYVALAEELDVPVATLDVRLTRAPGPTCEFTTPPRRS